MSLCKLSTNCVECQLRGVPHVFKVRLESEDAVQEIVNEMRRRLLNDGDENVHEEEDIVNDGMDGNDEDGKKIEHKDENKIEDGNESEEEAEDVD